MKTKSLPLDVESEARTDISDEPMETDDDKEDHDGESEEKDDGGSVYERETETENTASGMESDVDTRIG